MAEKLTLERKIEMTEHFIDYYDKIINVIERSENTTAEQAEFYKENRTYYQEILTDLIANK